MGVQLTTWDDGKTKIETQRRWRSAYQSRTYLEDRWIRNEKTIYMTTNGLNASTMQASLQNSYIMGMPGIDGSDSDMAVAYVFKNFRFLHAQMSANPPSVAMRPATSDQDDHRKADAADRVVRWALRHFTLQEKMDQLSLHTLLYGTGFIKTVWDSTRGDILGFDEESGEVQLEGDIAVSTPFVWNIFMDPDAKSMEELKWVFERIYMDYDEALQRWPDKEDFLKRSRIMENDKPKVNQGRTSQLQDYHYNSVELLEYWETGLPTNGYLGRYCITTPDGDVIEPCRPSPFRFKQAGSVYKVEQMDKPDEVKEKLIERLPDQAFLPYHILTDIDIPNMVWGRSFIEYASQLQDNLNRLDTAYVDAIQAHGVVRMVIPESAELSEESPSNSNWDVMKITGSQPPYFMAPPAPMQQMTETRANIIEGINQVSGVNESMFGQQSREQSGASMQYATNQGNMIRRRLFNKYVLVVESLFGKGILNLVRKHWSIARTIEVVGKEKAMESIDLKGSDIDGGYDVVGEYGTTLSLDPVTRREEILTMQPLFEKAGVPPRKLMSMLKLNELEGTFDSLEKAGDRQKEIFDEMIATGSYIPPKKYRDHENMIAWALDYFMTSEYTILPDEVQALCEKHIEDRGTLAAQEGSGTTPGGAPPGPDAAPAPAGAQPAGMSTPVPSQAPTPGGMSPQSVPQPQA